MTISRNLSVLAENVNSTGQVSLTTGVSGTVPVANGGTGAATLTANNVLLGNGTSALGTVAPGTTGNILTSNGTTWTSAAPSGGVTSVNGQTGAVVTTDFGGIGSTALFAYAGTSEVSAGGTTSGSNLRYGNGYTFGNQLAAPFVGRSNATNSNSYPSGGTSLSGTWRKMAGNQTWSSSYDPCSGNTSYAWFTSIWTRVS